MDEANRKSCDALLKSLEEYRPGLVRPILWAWDLAEVSTTIQSRCIARWALGDGEEYPDEYRDLAWQICDAAASEQDLCQVLAGLKESKDLVLLSRAIARCVVEGEGFLDVWEALRPELEHRPLSPVGFTYALLKASLREK
jgi:hypothetical protein